MNKKLLTLAVAGAIVGGMGVAQADVTVYGKAHVSLDSMHVDMGSGAAYANDGNLVVANNSSRLGFKFSEDLGGSFFKKAVGQYEASVSIDGEDAENTGGTSGTPAVTSVSTGLFGGAIRNSFLGVETAGGTVLAGIYDTPFKIVGRAVELFPEQLGDARNLTSPGGASWDLRPSNVVAYMSPSLAGMSVAVAWTADASTGVSANTDNNANTVASASVAYKGGPLYVAGAYEVHDSNILTAGTPGPENETGYRIVASGTFGMFKVIGLYQGLSDVNGVSGADRDVWGLGAAATLAEKHVIKAQYYSAGDIGATADSGADMYAVGYDFKVSKKTTAYVNYAMTSNGAAGSFGVNAGGHGDTLSASNNAFNNADVSGVSAGMIMDF
jgi:predicted porin